VYVAAFVQSIGGMLIADFRRAEARRWSHWRVSGALRARLQVPTKVPFIQRSSVWVRQRRPMAYPAGLSVGSADRWNQARPWAMGFPRANPAPRMLSSFSNLAAPTLLALSASAA
jgi:hypothetical protein